MAVAQLGPVLDCADAERLAEFGVCDGGQGATT